MDSQSASSDERGERPYPRIDERAWRALQRVFLHDLNNVLAGLMHSAERLNVDPRDPDAVRSLGALIKRLNADVKTHVALTAEDPHRVPIKREAVLLQELVDDIELTFNADPLSHDKRLCLPSASGTVTTDRTLLLRVLANMVRNALEATTKGGEVRFRIDQTDADVAFRVWNARAIPEVDRARVFQRYFSTKDGAIRGLGTYSMRLLGERLLGGKVSFTSSEDAGTEFRFHLDRESPGA